MNDHIFGMFDMGLVGVVVVGLAAWQLWSINREIGRDKKPPADPPSDMPGG